MKKHKHLADVRRVLGLLGELKWRYLLHQILAIASVIGLVLLNSQLYKKVVNGVISGEIALLYQAGVLVALVLLLIGVVTPVTSYYATVYGKRSLLEVRSALYARIVSLPVPYFREHSSGEILSRLTNDVSKVEAILDGDLYVVFESFGIGCSSLVMMFVLDWRLALVVLTLGAFTVRVNMLYAEPLRKLSGQVQALLGGTTQRFLDLIHGNRMIKLFSLHRQITAKYTEENEKVLKHNFRLMRKEAEKDGVNFLLNGVFYVGVLGSGAWMVSRGMVDLGTVVAVFSLRLGVDDLFTKFGSSLANLQKQLAGADRLFELLGEEPECLEQQRYCFAGDSEGPALKLEEVTFGYNQLNPVLKEISLTVPRERVTALVGCSGAGKTTLLKLLTGLYTPDSGKITVNGLVNDATPEELRKHFAYVSQEAYLFDATIAENIRYGKPGASLEEIVRAAAAANAHEFIMSLPAGYDTRIGENSVRLSGGQRQRIAIARALIKDAPILLLDEATSALDSESEALVQEAIQRLMRGRTVLVIAHRLSTIESADLIYVFDGGKVVEAGRHGELLAQGGIYRLLQEAQFVH